MDRVDNQDRPSGRRIKSAIIAVRCVSVVIKGALLLIKYAINVKNKVTLVEFVLIVEAKKDIEMIGVLIIIIIIFKNVGFRDSRLSVGVSLRIGTKADLMQR